MEQDTLLKDGEVLLNKIRKHWMVYVEDFVLHVFCSLIFLCAATYLATHQIIPFVSANTVALGAMILIMFVLIFWTSFFYFWTKNYFDVWYVTDRHIIAIDQKEMFNRNEAFMELNKIQDVSFEKNGLIATFFGYGQLKVQTAGSEQVFLINDIVNVEDNAHAIMMLRDKAQGKV